ncbi:hypothetical protein QL093DRAFT_2436624, partial [Fusarium oxysporum]
PILEATGSANGPRPSAVNQEMYLELLHALEQLQHGETKNNVEEQRPEKRRSIYGRAWDAIAPSHELKEGLKVKQSLESFEIKHAVGLTECGRFSGHAGPNNELYYQYEIEIERAIESRIKKEGGFDYEIECGPKLIVTPVSMMWDLESLEEAEKEKEQQADREL